jgi:PIN domain nuclease of toxin-antitoxin system
VRLLLDSHVLLWALDGSAELKPDLKQRIQDAYNQVLVSAASIWEISIKHRLGKLDVPDNWVEFVGASGFSELSVTFAHALAAGALPRHHDDPFDRMLIAQAQIEGLVLVTRDRESAPYSIQILNA